MPRVAVEATLQAPMGPLRVTTTHLEYYSDVQRRAQAKRLRNLHDEGCQRAAMTAEFQNRESNVTFDPCADRGCDPHRRLQLPPENPAYARSSTARGKARRIATRGRT